MNLKIIAFASLIFIFYWVEQGHQGSSSWEPIYNNLFAAAQTRRGF